MGNEFVGAFAVLSVIVIILGAIFDWDFFFSHWKARRAVNFFGRNGARILYIVLGVIMIFCGIMMLIGYK